MLVGREVAVGDGLGVALAVGVLVGSGVFVGDDVGRASGDAVGKGVTGNIGVAPTLVEEFGVTAGEGDPEPGSIVARASTVAITRACTVDSMSNGDVPGPPQAVAAKTRTIMNMYAHIFAMISLTSGSSHTCCSLVAGASIPTLDLVTLWIAPSSVTQTLRPPIDVVNCHHSHEAVTD